MSFKSELPEWRYRLISQNVDVRRPVCPPPKKKKENHKTNVWRRRQCGCRAAGWTVAIPGPPASASWTSAWSRQGTEDQTWFTCRVEWFLRANLTGHLAGCAKLLQDPNSKIPVSWLFFEVKGRKLKIVRIFFNFWGPSNFLNIIV